MKKINIVIYINPLPSNSNNAFEQTKTNLIGNEVIQKITKTLNETIKYDDNISFDFKINTEY